MTKQEILHNLREKRNEMFPPKVEFGCEFLANDGSVEKDELFIWNEEDPKEPYRHCIFEYDQVHREHVESGEMIDWDEGLRFTILGKPLSLQDILLMMKRAGLGVCLYEDGSFQVLDQKNVDDGVFLEDKLDLTLPIHEQETKTLEKIYQLVK